MLLISYMCHECYLTMICVLGGEENQLVESVNSTKSIVMLQPHTNYTFYVRAYNNRGASEPSAYIVQATKEDGRLCIL